MSVPFDLDFSPEYGRVDQVTPLVRRVVAENPGRFTFKGTATFVVGHGDVAVIDPGPNLPAHIDALEAALDGERVTHVLVTHTHTDHSPGVAPLVARTRATTYGFGPHPVADIEARRAAAAKRAEEEAERRDGDPAAEEAAAAQAEEGPPKDEGFDAAFVPDVVTGDGDVIEGDGWTIEALHTPGHISNHLCFALAEERLLFSGDHVMGWSTSVIPAPDGSLRDYMVNLRRLLDRDDAAYWPTHGPPITSPHDYVRALIAHRDERTDQVLSRLAAGDRTAMDIVRAVYTHVDPALHPAAAGSVLAHLVALLDDGRVAVEGEPSAEAEWRLVGRPTGPA